MPGAKTRGQDYEEKTETRLKTNLRRSVLEDTKLHHFWAQIVSRAPRHAQKMFINSIWPQEQKGGGPKK